MQRPSPVEAAPRPPSHVGATLECLGPGVVTRRLSDADPEILLGAGNPLAVVAFLALAPGRSASRERLVDLLWGDRDPASGRKQLRNALSHLRSRIGSWVVDEGERSCTLSGAVDADVFAFRAAIEDGYPARALDLYRGDFLSGFASPGATEFELTGPAPVTVLSWIIAKALAPLTAVTPEIAGSSLSKKSGGVMGSPSA